MPSTYQKVFLVSDKSRWCNLDQYGNRNKITLPTTSGKSITRTVQFYQLVDHSILVQITYQGRRMLISTNTILRD